VGTQIDTGAPDAERAAATIAVPQRDSHNTVFASNERPLNPTLGARDGIQSRLQQLESQVSNMRLENLEFKVQQLTKQSSGGPYRHPNHNGNSLNRKKYGEVSGKQTPYNNQLWGNRDSKTKRKASSYEQFNRGHSSSKQKWRSMCQQTNSRRGVSSLNLRQSNTSNTNSSADRQVGRGDRRGMNKQHFLVQATSRTQDHSPVLEVVKETTRF